MLQTRKEVVFLIMAGIFITSAIVAELISCKIIETPIYPIIAGIIPWPVVFLLTDVMNEYFGKSAVKKLSWITVGLIAFCFLIVYVAVSLPGSPVSPVSDAEFSKIFSGSLPIMLGSISAFILSQLIDVKLFHLFNKWTKGKMIWLRSTGSTVVSQLVDSYTVLMIGFLLPGKITFTELLIFGITGYTTKLVLAVLLTPFIYVMHYFSKSILGLKQD